MKNWILFALMVITIGSCRKNEEKAFVFEMEYPVDFTINAGIGPYVSHIFEIQDIPTFADSLFAFHDFKQENVSDILPRTGQMIPVFTEIDFAFIKSIDVELYDVVNGTIKRIPSFYRDPVPENTGEIVDLISEEIDLKDFLLQDRFNVRVKLQLYAAAPKTVETRMILKFAVR